MKVGRTFVAIIGMRQCLYDYGREPDQQPLAPRIDCFHERNEPQPAMLKRNVPPFTTDASDVAQLVSVVTCSVVLDNGWMRLPILTRSLRCGSTGD
jgi:hypothetical protein